MKRRLAWLSFAALVLPACAADTNRIVTVSSSRQIAVHAPNALMSSALCAYAERIKREWLLRLDVPDRWHDTIVFVVRNREAGLTNAPMLAAELFQFESQLKYQLTIVIPPAPDDALLGSAIVELLCAETANRDQPHGRGLAYVGAPIPVWLSEGLAQSILGRSEQLLTVVRRSAAGSRPQTAMEIMSITALPRDPADRTLYRANAWLLTEGLLRLPNGTRKMQQLLSELGATKIFARAFENVYADDFPDTVALEKWWSLRLTRARETTVAENLSTSVTAKRLDALLTVEVDPHPNFSQLFRYYDQPWLKPLLQNKLAGLATLRSYGHSLYRPVISKYMEAISQLLAVQLNRFRRTAHEADRQRRAVDKQAQELEEALDRAERKYSVAGTNEFESFFRTLDRLEKFEQQRRDPINDYLDQFDQ